MEIYKNKNYSFEERATDLVSRMTLEEKVFQVGNSTAAIPRLGVPAYDYWSEASHGFFGPFEIKEMDVTSYPVCLAMSQSWDRDKIKKTAKMISDEIRAHHNINGIELHMWCPTVNMARDPRNGRSDENFGEDPYLTGTLSASYIQGLQGADEDKKYLKCVATPKHYALNSSENNRHNGSSNADEATIREYYTRQFSYAVKEGKAESIMTSYNRINGVPASCNDMLLTTLLREEWGFDGFVVSDCGAVADAYFNPMFSGWCDLGHFYAKNMEEASAMTLVAGTDVSCGAEHKKALLKAVEQGMISEDIIDRAAIRALTSRFRLGLFDEGAENPYDRIGEESVSSPAMHAVSLDMANDTIVLLKNDKKLLPINKAKIKRILVVGPNAIYRQLGGYSAGQLPYVDTTLNVMALDGIKEAAGNDVSVTYEKGWCTGVERGKKGLEILPGFDPEMMMLDASPAEGMSIMEFMANPGNAVQPRHVPEDPDYNGDDDKLFARALEAAKDADMVIMVAGTDASNGSEEFDRENLQLPYGQNEKIKQMLDVNENTVVVLTTMGAVTGDFMERAHTLVNAHFAGEAQGAAIANVLFGKVNPNAKLTATWYKNVDDLPDLNDYGIKKQDTYSKKARTYMYFDGDVLFPFGYGLSYTDYKYSNLQINKVDFDANEEIEISLDVTNTGYVDGAEIIQIYIAKNAEEKQKDNKPFRQLKGYKKVFLKSGETKTVRFKMPVKDVSFWSNFKRRYVVEPGTYRIEAAASSADIRLTETIKISGQWDARLSNVYALADKYCYHIGDTGHINVSAVLDDAEHLRIEQYAPEYISSDKNVAEVDSRGTVTATGNGACEISVKVLYKEEVVRKVAIAVN